ncbi:MAG: hypothetical protein ACJA2S_000716 [Cyclobacteriaceae bacterium]|jgi:hypothetical protein
MRSILNIVVTVILLFTLVGGLEVLDSNLANVPIREMTPESENTNEEVIHFFHSDQKISKQVNQHSVSVDKPILLLPSSYVSQSIVSKNKRYILYGAILI